MTVDNEMRELQPVATVRIRFKSEPGVSIPRIPTSHPYAPNARFLDGAEQSELFSIVLSFPAEGARHAENDAELRFLVPDRIPEDLLQKLRPGATLLISEGPSKIVAECQVASVKWEKIPEL